MIHVVKDMQLSKNFRLSEFVCKEGKNEVYVDMKLINKLQELRDYINKSIEVVSGYRSPAYNQAIGGAEDSRHMYGDAADIKVKDMKPLEVGRMAEQIGFDGIGIYDTWTHVDTRGYRARWGDWATATFDKVGTTDIVYADPLSVYGEIVKMAGNKITGDFVNGGFYELSTMTPISPMVVNGALLIKRLAHDTVRRGTLIIYRDGTVQVKMIQDIDKEESLSNIHFAISGFNMFPLNLSAELWPDDISRKDWRTVMGYNPAKGKIVIAVRPDTTAERGKKTLVNLGCDRGIGLDAGGSTNARMNGKAVRLTDRVLHNIIRW